MKILTKGEMEQLIENRYGSKKSFKDGVDILKKENRVTVLNRDKSKKKKYAVCESILK